MPTNKHRRNGKDKKNQWRLIARRIPSSYKYDNSLKVEKDKCSETLLN